MIRRNDGLDRRLLGVEMSERLTIGVESLKAACGSPRAGGFAV
jgi:hypothetical protein